MRIAQIAPLVERVPPTLYGSTARVVSWLTEELVAMGHEVTLFASGDSVTRAALEPIVPPALRSAGNTTPHASAMMDRAAARQDGFDILHFHIDPFRYPLFRRLAHKSLTTLYGRQDLPGLHRVFADAPLVCISNHQRGQARRMAPAMNWRGTVHHGMPEALLKEGRGEGGYLAFLGRICREKGILPAIEIARRAGLALKVAAKVDAADRGYFEQMVRPVLERSPHVEFIGEIGDAEKSELLGQARALLFPVSWPEPFGLVMVESMACGTPVIAFDRGAVPEIIEDGLTGFVVEDIDEAVAAVARLDRLYRPTIRSRFEERFSARAMAREYVKLYRELAASGKAVALTMEASVVSPLSRLACASFSNSLRS